MDWAKERRCRLGRVALVPTMGALHVGHLSLIELARMQADEVVVSLFVNPTQFGEVSDLTSYPKTLEQDKARCEALGVDVLFAPSADRVYAPDASVWIDEEQLSRGLCGGSRPGHFRGVCTIVLKLFNWVQPDLAVFGEIGLSGEIRPAPRGQERLKEAAKLGFKYAIVPASNLPKQPLEGIEVIGAARIEQALDSLRDLGDRV